MNDGQVNERIDEDLELVDLEPAADEQTMIAHAQVALAALKWEPENVPVIAGYLIQADRQLRIAGTAVEARLRLSDAEERVAAAHGETVPTAA